MDLWVVAAATGAGYIAKYWQKLSGENEGSTDSYTLDKPHGQSESHNSLHQIRDRNRPSPRSNQNPFGKDKSFDIDESECDGVASTSGGYGEGLTNLGNIDEYNVLSLASVPPLLHNRDHSQRIGDQNNGRTEFSDKPDDLLPDYVNGETSYFYRSLNQSKKIRSRRPYGYVAKPLNSLESCLTAQLYHKHAKLEEYMCTPNPLPSTQMVRPLLVTDGRRIISRASSDFREEMRFDDGNRMENLGASSLPKRSMEFQRIPRQSFGKIRSKRMSSSVSRVSTGSFNSQGSTNGMLLLFLGITIGIISTVAANKREVEKLNDLLKQSENLVQDLHEELEMKDVLTVKEIPSEKVNSTFTKKKMNHEKEESFESMSKIEAELEAELERLELNMKGSVLERISDSVELDPDFEADMAQGELRLDKLNMKPSGSSDSNHDTTEEDNDTGNYAVSPRELSLRLHEVIQSRLEARITELETALEENRKKINSMEFERINSRTNSYSEIESSSTQGSPMFLDECEEIDLPLVLNLSGEALDAYNEAYDEICGIAQTDNEYNSRFFPPNDCDGTSEEGILGNLKLWETSISRESKEIGESEDEDEFGMMLIKQIVEKARKGSSVVLNAQKMLYSSDDQ